MKTKRVKLLKGAEIPHKKGARTVYHGGSVYLVDEKQAAAWLKDGTADPKWVDDTPSKKGGRK
jgi:hypothetical protein